MIRRLAHVLGLACVALLLLGGGAAFAQEGPEPIPQLGEGSGEQPPPDSSGEHRSVGGSDTLDNVSPPQLRNLSDTYWEKYPISHYGLDYHVTGVSFDVSGEILPWDSGDGVDFSGIPALIASMIIKVFWYACLYAVYGALVLFQFAFDFNLLTGDDNALNPISSAIAALDDALGLEWIAAGVSLFGLWAMWRALVQRRYGEAVSGFVASGAILLAALAFTLFAQPIVTFASNILNATSQQFLAIGAAMAPETTGDQPGVTPGEVEDIQSERNETLAATNALFKLFVYDSFVVLNFGGLQHCGAVGDDDKIEGAEAPVSMPVSECPDRDPTMSRTDDRWDLVSNSYYANRYLSYGVGDPRRCCAIDDEAKSEYAAIVTGDSGRLPLAEDELIPIGNFVMPGTNRLDPPPPGYPRALKPQDAPAVDIQQAPAQYQRLGMVALAAFFIFGGVLLIIGLSIAVIVAQLLFLFVLAFAPVIAVISFIPRHGPEIGLGWLKRLAILAGAKIYYSLLLALVIAISFALLASAREYGWLMAAGLTGLLLWILFFYRKRIQELITTGAGSAGRSLGIGRYVAYGGAVWAGSKVMHGAGAGLRLGGRGAKAAGRAGGPVAAGAAKAGGTAVAHPVSAGRAALDAPGRYRDIYRAGREHGATPRAARAAARERAWDAKGARANRGQRNYDSRREEFRYEQEQAARKARNSVYFAERKRGKSPAEALKTANAKWEPKRTADRAVAARESRPKAQRAQRKIETLREQSAAKERAAINRRVEREERVKTGRPSGNTGKVPGNFRERPRRAKRIASGQDPRSPDPKRRWQRGGPF